MLFRSGQMGLMLLALAVLVQAGASASLPLVIGCLFINHLLAKAGLFWLAGTLRQDRLDSRVNLPRSPLALTLLGLLIVAIAGLPPFPGFWAKWELITQLSAAGQHYWIAVILAGSLLEAAYMFKWFGLSLQSDADDETRPVPNLVQLLPPLGAGLLLLAAAYGAARMAGAASPWLFAPLAAGAGLFAMDGLLPGRAKASIMLAVTLAVGLWLYGAAGGIAALFAGLLLAGGLVIAASGLYRSDARLGYYPLLATLLLSIMALLRASTSLEFFFSWEIITLSSYFLIARSQRARPYLLSFLLFSLLAAFFILAGFASTAATTGSIDLAALRLPGAQTEVAFVLMAIGFLIKAGVVGVHVWLPGSYAEAEDVFSAMLSGVVSKVAIYGLLLVTYLTIRTELSLGLAHAMAWVGLATVIGGALMALRQQDFKRLLAYSSLSQLGYIVLAIALMSHLGWVTALYLVANHMMVKGILFLGVAGVIAQTGARTFDTTGGLRRAMPVTFVTMLVAIVSMSGLPPLMGFGGKWLLLNAMIEKGWNLLAIASLFGTLLGFLYMVRLILGLFFGERSKGQDATREASPYLLAPQMLLIIGIIVLSFFPQLLFEPISTVIDPKFAVGLFWKGMSLESAYYYWNPVPALLVALAGAGVFFIVFWLIYRARAKMNGLARFYSYYRPVIARFLPPLAIQFWRGVSVVTLAASGEARRLYTGNGQTYMLYVLYYFLALYLASTGLRSLGLSL